MVEVFPGFCDTFAKLLRPNSALSIEDLPTFDLPANATSGSVEGGSCEDMPNERSNATLLKFMMLLAISGGLGGRARRGIASGDRMRNSLAVGKRQRAGSGGNLIRKRFLSRNGTGREARRHMAFTICTNPVCLGLP